MKGLISFLIIALLAVVAGLVLAHDTSSEPHHQKPNAELLHQSIIYGLMIENESPIIYSVISPDGKLDQCVADHATLNYTCTITALSGNQYIAHIEIEEIDGYRIATPATMEAIL